MPIGQLLIYYFRKILTENIKNWRSLKKKKRKKKERITGILGGEPIQTLKVFLLQTFNKKLIHHLFGMHVEFFLT